MKKYKIFASMIALAGAMAIAPSPARAQAATAAALAAPIIEKVINTIAPATSARKTPQGMSWLKAEVIRFDFHSIVVRDQAQEMMIRTFTYAPELQDRMQAIQDRGGYQYGDKVTILYMPGQTVAVKILGKPSKSL